MEITPQSISEWVTKAFLGKVCTPTLLHVLHSNNDESAANYHAFKNPPDPLELACAYLKVSKELEELRATKRELVEEIPHTQSHAFSLCGCKKCNAARELLNQIEGGN